MDSYKESLIRSRSTRDPRRIPVVLEELRKYWEKHPDLRLGQIVGNIAGRKKCDPYNLEEIDIIEGLRNLSH